MAFVMLLVDCSFEADMQDLVHTLVLIISARADLRFFHFCFQEFTKANLTWRKGRATEVEKDKLESPNNEEILQR